MTFIYRRTDQIFEEDPELSTCVFQLPVSLIVVELLLRRHISPQDMLLKVPRQHPPVMVDMLPGRDRKDLIQFLQGQCFGLRQTEVAEDPAKEVPRRIPPERALRRKRVFQGRPCEGDNEIEAPGCGGCE